MSRYEVELILCRTVTVTVEAESEKRAQEAALDSSRWLHRDGMRSRMHILCTLGAQPAAREPTR